MHHTVRSLAVLGIALSTFVACEGATPLPPAPPAPPIPTATGTAPTPTTPTATSTAPTPSPTASATKCSGQAPAPDYECVQDCGPPVARPTDPPPGWRWLSPADAKNRKTYGCPICLPPDARIATPDGERPISELSQGARVFTLDERGRRVEARVLYAGSTPISGGHRLVRVTLADGRVVSGSGGHPTGSGGTLGQLRARDGLADSVVVNVEVIPFASDRTWDVLPSGPTGLYVVDGVVLQSSFFHQAPSRETVR